MMGGGFFGSGASSTDTQSTAVQNTQYAESGAAPLSLAGLDIGGKKNNVNLNVVSNTQVTDHGAIAASFGVAQSVIDDAFRAVSDTAAFSYDGVSKIADVLNQGHGYNVGLAYDLANINRDITQDVIASNTGLSLSVLQSSERFADNAALLSLEHSRMSGQAFDRALNAVYQSSVNSQNLAVDAIDQVSSAYNFANQGLLAATSDFSASLATVTDRSLNNLYAINTDYMRALEGVQSHALEQIGESGQAAQSASLKALDYVFESTKSAEERSLTDSIKWIVGGLVLVFAMPLVARALK